jgi:dinuclear metal center YbgI/SA1388 family protein
MSSNSERSIDDVVRALLQRAPQSFAEDWDNVGLLVGDEGQKTSGAVVSIDLTFEAVQLALEKGYKLIVNHHPCIFPKTKGLSRVLSGSPVYEAIRNGICVAASHTNFDQCSLEVVQAVSEGLGLNVQGRLFEKSQISFLKLVTFVPADHLEQVRTAVCEAGAGNIGNYDFCSFGAKGEGTFRGGKDTHPRVGQPGQLEKVEEIRFETVFPRGLKDQILKALLSAHPYEEVAYELYSVEQTTKSSTASQGIVSGLGYGFWGEFPSRRPFSEVAKDVKSLFDIHGFWITNPVPSYVSKVGFVAGKGASFVEAAAAARCDLFITGEAGYHTALGGSRRGVAVMELGHRESEKFFVKTMKSWLTHLGLEVAEAQTPTQQIWLGGKK